MALISADELRGIKPHKTLTGRIVNNDDPPEPVKIKPRVNAMDQVRDFVARAEGMFSPYDISIVTGIPRKVVSEYLSRFKKAGAIQKTGYVPVGPMNKPMCLWKRK